MEKFSYILLFIILLVNNFRYNYEEEKELITLNLNKEKVSKLGKLAHPIDITFDFWTFSNIHNLLYLSELIQLLENAKNIISSLILTTNDKIITNKDSLFSYFNSKFFKIEKENITVEIIIVPVFKRFSKKDQNMIFQAEILKEYHTKIIPPLNAILYINNRIDFSQIFNNKNSKHILLLESLRALTDCIGLSYKFIQKKKQPKNNFFQTPLHLLANSNSFKSILKLYDFLDKPLPEFNISVNGQFYLSYWDKDSTVQDFRNEEIDLKSDLSEVSMNLFNDMDNYLVAECDFQKYYYNDICYRIDQKCLNIKEVRSLYLNFGINIEKENEVICYLSNPDNLKKNQCGIKYGHLLRENLDFCPISKKLKNKISYKKPYLIPELEYVNNQTLNLLKPSGKCKNFPRSIFFNFENRTDIIKENISIETITFNESYKNFFVTYITEYEVYFNQYVKILEENGLIRSYYHNKIHNLFIKYFYPSQLKGQIGLNKYQRYFQFIGNDIYFDKDELYLNYLYMKSYFPKSYNFMPKTYIYPNDKEKIEIKFKNYSVDTNNLWIVKPTDLFSGKGIHIFKSLEEEKREKYVISKYINNPHLIKGRKYDLRLYVLITGFKPLRIYLNKEGLVRISAEQYSLKKKSIDNKYIHLTNTAINHDNKKYVFPQDVNDENANKWNLNTYNKYLKKQNIDVDLLFDKIKDVIIKAVISGQRKIINITSELNVANQTMFNLFGFDVLIDDNLEPILLEINTRPFMYIYDPMDKVIKTNLFIDILNIIGITPFSHQRKYKSFDKDTYYSNKIKENVDYAFCEISRPRGDLELIFPLKENIRKFKKFFFIKAGEENKLFWKEILKNK